MRVIVPPGDNVTYSSLYVVDVADSLTRPPLLLKEVLDTIPEPDIEHVSGCVNHPLLHVNRIP